MEKNMKENFEKLERRVFDSLYDTDLEKINYELSKIDGPTLVSGVGGSSVASEYASKILSNKNHIITRNTEPRDFMYIDTNLYKNVLACSYSGNNYAGGSINTSLCQAGAESTVTTSHDATCTIGWW